MHAVVRSRLKIALQTYRGALTRTIRLPSAGDPCRGLDYEAEHTRSIRTLLRMPAPGGLSRAPWQLRHARSHDQAPGAHVHTLARLGMCTSRCSPSMACLQDDTNAAMASNRAYTGQYMHMHGIAMALIDRDDGHGRGQRDDAHARPPGQAILWRNCVPNIAALNL